MSARVVAACACAAFLAVQLTAVCAQNGIYVEVSDRHHDDQEVEKKMTPELVRDLQNAKYDALLLYTQYTAKAGSDLKMFLTNISQYADEAFRAVERPAYRDEPTCRSALEDRLKKIKIDAYKAASFSGENHHKFLLGHMVVFRMHLNKTDEYIRKCDRVLNRCGRPCENKVRRWKRLALDEIHRVRDDLQHTRRSYKDLVAHARRRLNHIRKEITVKTTDAAENYYKCVDDNYKYD